jgi:hypothetical protein
MHPVHRYLRRAALFLRGRPPETREFQELLRNAREWAATRQDALKRVFEIGSYERFDWYQEKGIIIFSNAGSPKVVADVQFAGSISFLTHSWLWAWRNETFLEPVTRASEQVREAGERAGYEKLTRPKWYADENDGWDMTSIQSLWTSAEGLYRSRSETGSTFMTLSRVRWAKEDEWYVRAED